MWYPGKPSVNGKSGRQVISELAKDPAGRGWSIRHQKGSNFRFCDVQFSFFHQKNLDDPMLSIIMAEIPHATLIENIRPILTDILSTSNEECAGWAEVNVAGLASAWSHRVRRPWWPRLLFVSSVGDISLWCSPVVFCLIRPAFVALFAK